MDKTDKNMKMTFEQMFEALVSEFGVNGVMAACESVKKTGWFELKHVDRLTHKQLTYLEQEFYYIFDVEDYEVLKDWRQDGIEQVKVRVTFLKHSNQLESADVSFGIEDDGTYKLVYFTGADQVIVRNKQWSACIAEFVKKLYNKIG